MSPGTCRSTWVIAHPQSRLMPEGHIFLVGNSCHSSNSNECDVNTHNEGLSLSALALSELWEGSADRSTLFDPLLAMGFGEAAFSGPTARHCGLGAGLVGRRLDRRCP